MLTKSLWKKIQKADGLTQKGTKVTRVGSSAVLALSLASCVTVGKDFKSDTSWIKEGHTKQNDVTLILGEPRSVGNASGSPTWTYGYYQYKLFSDSCTKELKFYWKKDGTVDQFSFNSSFPEDISRAGIPQQPSAQGLRPRSKTAKAEF
jgi:hypothetical protein